MDENAGKGNGRARRIAIETAVTVFVLGYGLHYFGYFLRARYFNYLNALPLDEGLAHCLGYLGHMVFLCVLLLYAWAVRRDRKYILSFCRGQSPTVSLRRALCADPSLGGGAGPSCSERCTARAFPLRRPSSSARWCS